MASVSCNLSSFVLVFMLIGTIQQFINASSLLEACSKAAESSPTINRNFCLGSLQVDPKSGSANFAGLAQITTELTSKNATSTKTMIQNMLASTGNDKNNIKEALTTCSDLYSGMIDYLSDAATAISSFRNDDAETYLSAAVDAPCDCEDTFSQKGVVSVLAKEDADIRQLLAIALAFLNM